METALQLARKGKILYALMFLKDYVTENQDKWDNSIEICRGLLSAIMSMPSLNDESWGIFVPTINLDDFEKIISRVNECIRY
ncbi:hypothetical protein SULI_07585 [Saccharolobus solfataricus]|uniref:Uncharacterized protein n=2 Tax=Saccharolobus solfataricus TaxID=2287 RepID=A0A0E3JU00_SACSO|nr:hypothetical protein [Saccharolobus solfataricus]AKA73792.1 hypothetical protein SULB_1524 [Saccharolobus solfataricus]AKA76489.1 hypothetical protein SULC_1522 [Saccharolobus solfataricus]AKA79182.1 hypothetical protein SULA_1523 [Saccharolobus solfataricus]AZF68268.1 hypothetical protein SULG_07585 [Saccharolobus solfataricus]AZF70888.1 hypothetical protein SULH_07585 [Saccharolobus solfataricus]